MQYYSPEDDTCETSLQCCKCESLSRQRDSRQQIVSKHCKRSVCTCAFFSFVCRSVCLLTSRYVAWKITKYKVAWFYEVIKTVITHDFNLLTPNIERIYGHHCIVCRAGLMKRSVRLSISMGPQQQTCCRVAAVCPVVKNIDRSLQQRRAAWECEHCRVDCQSTQVAEYRLDYFVKAGMKVQMKTHKHCTKLVVGHATINNGAPLSRNLTPFKLIVFSLSTFASRWWASFVGSQHDANRTCCWAPAPAARRPQLSIDTSISRCISFFCKIL